MTVPKLDEDKSPIAPFDVSRSMRLNAENEMVRAIHALVGTRVEEVRRRADPRQLGVVVGPLLMGLSFDISGGYSIGLQILIPLAVIAALLLLQRLPTASWEATGTPAPETGGIVSSIAR